MGRILGLLGGPIVDCSSHLTILAGVRPYACCGHCADSLRSLRPATSDMRPRPRGEKDDDPSDRSRRALCCTYACMPARAPASYRRSAARRRPIGDARTLRTHARRTGSGHRRSRLVKAGQANAQGARVERALAGIGARYRWRWVGALAHQQWSK
jgi:hypothetical protein